MTAYRRFYIPGATWFFTVNLAEKITGVRYKLNAGQFGII